MSHHKNKSKPTRTGLKLIRLKSYKPKPLDNITEKFLDKHAPKKKKETKQKDLNRTIIL